MATIVQNTGTNYTLYYNVLNYFRTIMSNHPSILSVSQGDIVDIDVEQYPAYPLGNVLITNSTFGTSVTEFTVQLIVADKIKNRNNESEGERNYQVIPFYGVDDLVDIHANTLAILNDLTAYTQRGLSGFEINGDITCTPFADRFNNGLAGWQAEFTLTTHNDKNRCLFFLTSPSGSGYVIQDCSTGKTYNAVLSGSVSIGNIFNSYYPTATSCYTVINSLTDFENWDLVNLPVLGLYNNCVDCNNALTTTTTTSTTSTTTLAPTTTTTTLEQTTTTTTTIPGTTTTTTTGAGTTTTSTTSTTSTTAGPTTTTTTGAETTTTTSTTSTTTSTTTTTLAPTTTTTLAPTTTTTLAPTTTTSTTTTTTLAPTTTTTTLATGSLILYEIDIPLSSGAGIVFYADCNGALQYFSINNVSGNSRVASRIVPYANTTINVTSLGATTCGVCYNVTVNGGTLSAYSCGTSGSGDYNLFIATGNSACVAATGQSGNGTANWTWGSQCN